MTGKCGADFLPRRCRGSLGFAPAIVKRRRLDDKARRAEPALQRVVRHESVLDRMQLAGADALDRVTDLSAAARAGIKQLTTGRSVHQHGAGAADAGPTHEFCAGSG